MHQCYYINCVLAALFQFPITALREIKILQLLKHENVVNLIEICRTKGWCHQPPVYIFALTINFCLHVVCAVLFLGHLFALPCINGKICPMIGAGSVCCVKWSSFFPLIVLKATQFNRYKGSIYLVFDFCEHDLAGLLSNANVKFTLAEIKKVMQMLLNGLYYIHRNKVRHWYKWPSTGSFDLRGLWQI